MCSLFVFLAMGCGGGASTGPITTTSSDSPSSDFAAMADMAGDAASRSADGAAPDMTTTPSTGGVKWHPGHYMLSDEMDRSASNQIANKRNEQTICKASGNNVRGWVGSYTWQVLEPTKGGYDFSHIDADLAELNSSGGCSRVVIQVSSGLYGVSSVEEVVPQYILDDATYGASNADGYGYWTVGGGGSYAAAIWRPAVMARWAALFAALGEKYDGNVQVEAIGVNDESVMPDNLTSGSDYSDDAMETQWATLQKTAVAAMPHTSFIFQVNFFGDPQATADIMQTAYANRAAFGGPDIFGASDDTSDFGNGADIWGITIFEGRGATTPGTDYRGKMPCLHDIQSPELIGGEGLKQYTPSDIFTEADQNMQCSHLFWNWWSQSGNSGDWQSGVLPVINAHALSHTECPSVYASCASD